VIGVGGFFLNELNPMEIIKLQTSELQIQKALLNMSDTELLETYCHEGFLINEIYNGKQVDVGICSSNFRVVY